MKNPTPIEVARIIVALLALLIFTFLLLAKLLSPSQLEWYIVVGSPIIVAFPGYFIISIAIEKFIYRKIKLIYKIISETKPSVNKDFEKINLGENIIDKVEEEVIEWNRNKGEELRKMKKMEAYRKEFLGNVSHELKTPLFSIQGYLETLIEGGLKDKKINKKFLQKANKNVDRIISIIDDLQMISNIEEDSFSVRPEKFNITELATETMEALEMQAGLKKVKLSFKDGCNKPFMVDAEKEMIQQVLNNLIYNSVKYGNKNGETQIGIYDMGKSILVEVSDNGIGIALKDLNRIFERFYRVDTNRSRKHGGSGLGLAIVKHIIEAHGQTINVRSTPEMGSTFGFTLLKA
ncbi:MAG: sensor histidine kinase [Bacteroidetes bacterium]|nr:MAG: sensor histidine kinase [Bacteroidota bacterium]